MPEARTPTPGIDLDALSQESRPTVMVVEDEPDTVKLLKQVLRMGGYDVLSALNGAEALRKISDHPVDLVMLDLMMPDMDGWETYRQIRKLSDVPVIVVSAIHNKDEVVRALQMGADDYLTKPFSNAEVVARAQAVLRRAKPAQMTNRLVFPAADFVIDFTTQEVILRKQRIQLTGKEFAVLGVLAKSAPKVVQYREIADQVWGEDSPQIRNRIKYLVYLLRQKLHPAHGEDDLINNIDRFGYKLRLER